MRLAHAFQLSPLHWVGLSTPGSLGNRLFAFVVLITLLMAPAASGFVLQASHASPAHATQDDSRSGAVSGAASQSITPNDDLYERYQWNLRRIHAAEGWRLTTGSPSITVAVLDTGVSLTHPELVRRVVAGYDFINEDAIPEDDHGNGTHVAGIIGAEANNRTGIAGIAWQSRIMPVKVLDAQARGDPDVAAQGVIWAVDHGANVINLGLAGPTPSTPLDDAIEYAYSRNVTVVAPMGNEGTSTMAYPAANPRVIAVAATDRLDARLATSNTGAYISVAAPGEQIASTFKSPGGPDTYAVTGTTAQAAAHVTGLIALMLSLNPTLTPGDIRTLLEASADDVGAPGRDIETGAGRINVYRALSVAAPWSFNAAGAASYAAAGGATNTAYFPLVLKEANGWNTLLAIQNPAPRVANLTVVVVDETGAQIGQFTATAPALGSAILVLSRIPAVPAGFVGAAIVQGDVPITGVANQDHPGRDRLSYVGLPAGTTAIWIPLLMRGASGWDTGLQLQNLSQTTTHARVSFFTQGETVPLAVSVAQLGPLAPLAIYQPTDRRIPNDWVGSALIESLDNQPLGAVVNELSDDGLGMAYTGVGAPAETLTIPLVYKNAADWASGIQVQNAGNGPATVTVSYTPLGGTRTVAVDRATIVPGTATTFYQGANPDLPDGFVGSATVTSLESQPLAAVANAVKQGARMATAYDAIGGGSSTLHIPLVYRDFAGWNAGLQLQNVGAATTSVNVTFYQEDGREAASVSRTLERGASWTLYVPDVAELGSAFVGSAIVPSLGGEPIAATVNQVK